jgi:hypothetical protein
MDGKFLLPFSELLQGLQHFSAWFSLNCKQVKINPPYCTFAQDFYGLNGLANKPIWAPDSYLKYFLI